MVNPATETPTLVTLGNVRVLGTVLSYTLGDSTLSSTVVGSILSASPMSVSTTRGAPDTKVTKDHADRRMQERCGGREREKKKKMLRKIPSSPDYPVYVCLHIGPSNDDVFFPHTQ